MNFDAFPEISFIGDDTLESTKLEMVQDYKDKYKEITGEEIELSDCDPYRMLLYACATQIYQTKLYVDHAGKMNFMKYSYEDYLDNLGANLGVTRSQGKAATVTLRFYLQETSSFAITIPKGTRVTSGNDVYFSTVETAEIPIGSLYVLVQASCTEIGEYANGYAVNTITTIVDTIAYVSVTNTTESSGGEEIESDDNLAERIFLAPSSASCGTKSSYIANCKSINRNITDVCISADDDATVDVVFLTNGNVPSETEINNLQAALYDSKIHTLTDKIRVAAPASVDYELNLTYYINSSDSTLAASIQTEVENAISTYIDWQKDKIGRDINPSYLSMLILNAGAKRCEIVSPSFTALKNTQIANLTSKIVTYGGIEND